MYERRINKGYESTTGFDYDDGHRSHLRIINPRDHDPKYTFNIVFLCVLCFGITSADRVDHINFFSLPITYTCDFKELLREEIVYKTRLITLSC